MRVAHQATQANKRRREIKFDVGNSVWATMEHHQSLQPSAKLSDCNASAFEILERRGSAFALDLLGLMKVHNVFNADKQLKPRCQAKQAASLRLLKSTEQQNIKSTTI